MKDLLNKFMKCKEKDFLFWLIIGINQALNTYGKILPKLKKKKNLSIQLEIWILIKCKKLIKSMNI